MGYHMQEEQSSISINCEGDSEVPKPSCKSHIPTLQSANKTVAGGPMPNILYNEVDSEALCYIL